jgi:hypothetical protein
VLPPKLTEIIAHDQPGVTGANDHGFDLFVHNTRTTAAANR